eukprot:355640-Chlamydomonas_euryale.AAC.1
MTLCCRFREGEGGWRVVLLLVLCEALLPLRGGRGGRVLCTALRPLHSGALFFAFLRGAGREGGRAERKGGGRRGMRESSGEEAVCGGTACGGTACGGTACGGTACGGT